MLQNILLFVVGILAGAMNAVGGGGMLIGFPVLLAAGLPALTANATLNIIVLPGQLASAFGYRKYLRQVSRSYLLLIIPCFVGAVIGASVLRRTSYSGFEHLVPWLILFAIILFSIQPLINARLRPRPLQKAIRHRPPWWLAIIIFPMAIYGGYFGAGFGLVLLAFLSLTNLPSIHQMNALKNLTISAITIASIITLYSAHLIDWRSGFVMGAGTLIGGYYGAVIAQKISPRAVRIIVIVIGFTTAGYLFFRH